ncbi:MAG: nucleotide exchange factor GrpE, partial [Rickettsiales bacterium]|jgi:molecular chaperone GrpE|nr:nucleotide exchange factor GrpE [Rickettsiales bacterium]
LKNVVFITIYKKHEKRFSMSKDKKEKHHHEHHRCGVRESENEAAENEAANPTAQADEWKDKALRAMAEAENAKRRAELDAKSAIEWSIAKFAADMLPLADNLALALKAAQGKADESVLAGLRALSEQFDAALSKNGIRRIKTVGEKLNPAEHCAVSQVECGGLEDGAVAEELLAGYKIGERVIREAMVAVAKKQ